VRDAPSGRIGLKGGLGLPSRLAIVDFINRKLSCVPTAGFSMANRTPFLASASKKQPKKTSAAPVLSSRNSIYSPVKPENSKAMLVAEITSGRFLSLEVYIIRGIGG
jgi:hypothetical protein